MTDHMKFVLAFFFILFILHPLLSQESPYVIDSIHITGNTRTKEYIIKKELDFKPGDSILLSTSDRIFEKNESRLLGTALFVKAEFNISEINTETKKIEISVTVDEAWFIYPYFYLELTDRNLSEWYYEHGAALNRINVTLNLQHNNLTGNRDKLELKWQTGITKKWELSYAFPIISKKHNVGITFNILNKRSSEIAFNTVNNKLAFHKDENKPMFRQFRISSGLTYRPSVYNHHSLKLTFFSNVIDTLISNSLNPLFFNNGDRQRYLDIFYTFYRDKRDYRIYPTNGYFFYVEIEKAGLGLFSDLNQLIVWSGFERHLPVWKNIFTSINIEAKKSIINNKTPYYNNFALGYNDRFLNGYELYVIDGQDYVYVKSSQKYNFLKGNLNLSRIISVRQFKHIPYYFYFSLNFDTGYVNNNSNFASNDFTNRMLYGYGAGLDFIVYHNLFRFTYSFNHKGEGGFYFHLKTIF
jgi:outer membrane protein assembly factor BamA